jgi:uncharacterized membrane protein
MRYRRLLHFWEKLKTSYWFVPAIMLLAAAGLALVMLTIDAAYFAEPREIWWLYAGGTEGARTLLATVAGSIITVTGVVFSISTAVLAQVSSQFGPRILRNFMRDPGNQVTLGTFVATFVYCLLVLRSIGGSNDTAVPHLAVTVAVLLSVASIGVLIYFIHHVSFTIQAPQVAAAVWSDVDDALDRMFPENLGRGLAPSEGQGETAFPPDFDQDSRAIAAPKTGYIQAVDEQDLMSVATRHDLRLKLLYRPGHFVIAGNPLVWGWPAGRAEGCAAQIQQAFIVGRYRTPEQDVEFAIHQLVEIAVRALSPGINDPFTACNCVDWLGDALCRIADEELEPACRYDEQHVLRILVEAVTFAGAVGAAFNQIRQYGRTSAAVTIRLLEAISAVALRTRTEEQREALRRQAMIIERDSRAALTVEEDRQDVSNRFQTAIRLLQPNP